MTSTKRLAFAECVLYGWVMVKPNDFRELIEAWGGIPRLADDLGVPYVAAQKMFQRNSIAAWHWPKLLQMASGKGILLTADRLVAMKPARKAPDASKVEKVA